MKAKHSLVTKLVAAAGVMGALTLSIGVASAANPVTVTAVGLQSKPGLAEHATNGDKVAFTVHSYAFYSALDIGTVSDGAFLSGVRYTSELTPICAAGGIPLPSPLKNGTNSWDGDHWYAACVGVINGARGVVRVLP